MDIKGKGVTIDLTAEEADQLHKELADLYEKGALGDTVLLRDLKDRLD